MTLTIIPIHTVVTGVRMSSGIEKSKLIESNINRIMAGTRFTIVIPKDARPKSGQAA